MAKITGTPTISFELTFTLTESEARALDALVGYGDDAFVKHFYTFLGKHYMEPHEKGLRSLFSSVREGVPGFLSKVDIFRKTFKDQ